MKLIKTNQSSWIELWEPIVKKFPEMILKKIPELLKPEENSRKINKIGVNLVWKDNLETMINWSAMIGTSVANISTMGAEM